MSATESLSNCNISSPTKPADGAELLCSVATNHPSTILFRNRSQNVQANRSVLAIPPEHMPESLMCTTLAVPGAVSKPYVFKDDETGSILAFYFLGNRLAGHVGIVHGGVTATLLDDCMGRAAFARLPNNIAVTAKLEIEYKIPIPLGSIIMIRADTIELQGRKAWVEAKVVDAIDGRDLAVAKALLIQPKWANEMIQIM